MEMTKNLSVRPGQASKPISFADYYNKNWSQCAFRWVFAFRKNLPTNGANDTQAIESTFSAIKRFSKLEFPSRTPTLTEFIQVLPRALDERTAKREKDIVMKRLTIYDPKPELNKALSSASWKLNVEGMKKFHECLKMAESKEQNMSLDDESITEKYTGHKTKEYTGHYDTDGFTCNCSWFASRKLCRHLFFYRKIKQLPLFDLKCFHPSFRFIQEPDESTADMFESFEENNRLASPGMEHLIEEQMQQNKKLKSNVKYNKGFDVAKVCVDYLSKYNTETFETNLEIFNVFTELMRTGIPEDVKDVILKHSSSSKMSSTVSSSTQSSSSTEPMSSKSSEHEKASQQKTKKPTMRDLPREHQVSTTNILF